MSQISAINIQAYEDFMKRDVKAFCKAFIRPDPSNDQVDNNICETFNSWIREARKKPCIEMLEEIRIKLMERMYEKKVLLEEGADMVCPNIRKKLEEIKVLARHCKVMPASDTLFEVSELHLAYIVDLTERKCDCRGWEISGIPCTHAVACIISQRNDPGNYVHQSFTRAHCLKSYKYPLIPLGGRHKWPKVEGEQVFGPIAKRMPGRPKKNRARDLEAEPRKGKERAGVLVKCKNCNKFGHNKRGCKEEPRTPSAAGTSEPKKRGRPRKGVALQESGTSKKTNVTMEAPRRRKRHTEVELGTQTSAVTTRSVLKDKRRASQGMGSYVSDETGKTYVREKGRIRSLDEISLASQVGSSSKP